jgi:hypothetical protein
MPPAVEPLATPTAIESARADLAHRLNAEVALVEVVSVTTREPEPAKMPCLAEDTVSRRIWGSAEGVTWITLSVKGNIHHYVALGDVVIYCDE